CPPLPTLFPYTTLFRSTPEGPWPELLVLRVEVRLVDERSEVPRQLDLRSFDERAVDHEPGRVVGEGVVLPGVDLPAHRREAPLRSEEHTSELQSRRDLV